MKPLREGRDASASSHQEGTLSAIQSLQSGAAAFNPGAAAKIQSAPRAKAAEATETAQAERQEARAGQQEAGEAATVGSRLSVTA